MKKTMLLLFALTASVVGEESRSNWRQEWRKQLSFTQELKTKAVVYQNGRDHLERQQLGVSFSSEVAWKPSENWLVFAQGRWRRDSASYSQGAIDRYLETGRRWSLDLPEAYVRYRQRWLEVKVGKQMFDWSVTDEVSPNDNLSPRDWTEIIDWERVAIPALSLKLVRDNGFIQAVYAPWLTPSKMPASRWRRQTVLEVDRHNYTSQGSQHQLALRAGTTVSGFDLGASYYNGVANSPVFQLDPIKMKLVPLYYRQQVLAASVAKELPFGYVVRAEIGYFDQKIGHDFTQLVMGVDKEWFEVLSETDSLYALLQYSDSFQSRRYLPVGVASYDIRRVLDKALMTKVKYVFDDSDRWAIGVEGAYNLRRGDSYAKPYLAWQGDAWQAELAYSVFAGKSSTFFGGYDRNQSVSFTISRKF